MPTTVTVHGGPYLKPDGTICTGNVTFQLSARLQDTVSGEFREPNQMVATLDATGAFDIDLVATDDANVQPANVVYHVVERIVGTGLNVYDIAVGVADAPTVDLADKTPVQAQPATFDYALVSYVRVRSLANVLAYGG